MKKRVFYSVYWTKYLTVSWIYIYTYILYDETRSMNPCSDNNGNSAPPKLEQTSLGNINVIDIQTHYTNLNIESTKKIRIYQWKVLTLGTEMIFIQNQLTIFCLFILSFFLLFEQTGNKYTWTFVASWSPSAPPLPPLSSFPSAPPLRTYSRTNKVVTGPLEPSAVVSAGAAALSAGLSDNVHISLLPEEPISSHFAFALETHTHAINELVNGNEAEVGGREECCPSVKGDPGDDRGSTYTATSLSLKSTTSECQMPLKSQQLETRLFINSRAVKQLFLRNYNNSKERQFNLHSLTMKI